MSAKNWNDLGEEFKKTINDALISGDFSNINNLVNDTVNCAIDEAKKQTQNAVSGISDEISRSFSAEKKGKQKSTMYANNSSVSYHYATPDRPTRTKEKANKKYQIKEAGKVGGVLFNTFGGIGLGVTIITTLSMFFYEMATASFSLTSFIGNAIFLCGFSWMIHKGKSVFKRIRRAKRYAKLGAESQYVTIDNLTSHSGKSKRYVLEDVHKMLELGMFPEGHLDDQETCLIFTNEMYKTYQQMQKSKKEIEQKEAEKRQQADDENKSMENNPELQQMIQEGNECIKKLRELNDEIEGEVISNKLFKLENLLKDIFAQIKLHPEKMREMHKVMNYYLPTTLKMVQAYADFDDVEEPGDDIIEAKNQIENTIDTINDAFNQLLNKLFLDKVYDVTTDAQVLQSILSREGLVKNELDMEREKTKLEV